MQVVLKGLTIAAIANPIGVRYVSNSTDSLTDVVLVAHQDDWQLFMGDALGDRQRFSTRTIFVYLTAGDDGRDSSYWRTRERAALASTQLELAWPDSAARNCGFGMVARHSIWRCGSGRVESYFLRLPDGRRNGRGFAVHQFRKPVEGTSEEKHQHFGR